MMMFPLTIIVQDRTGLKVSPGLLCVPMPQQKTGAALPAWVTAYQLHWTSDRKKTQHTYTGPG